MEAVPVFFYLSKIVWFLLQPSAFTLALIILGLLLLAMKRQKLGQTSIWAGAILYGLATVSPLGGFLMTPLENRIAKPDLSQIKNVHGIIVLGGAERPWISAPRDSFSFDGAGERFTESLILSRQYPEAKVVFSGGLWFASDKAISNAVSIPKFYQDMGLEEGRFSIEDQSRNTFENAQYTKNLIQPKSGETWLLVTSAFHMARAYGTFQAVGFDVIPFPVDYRTKGPLPWKGIEYYGPVGMSKTNIATKEWLGLLVYWLTGRIPSLFPKV